MKKIEKIGYYVLIPIISIGGLIWLLNINFFSNIEKSIEASVKIIQAFAILLGGLWAYHKFDWGKKAESAIKIKAMLMEYSQIHNEVAGQYRMDIKGGMSEDDAYGKYAISLLSARNNFVSQVHLSCYLPKKLREKIFNTVWLTVGNGHGENRKDLTSNWEKFEKESTQIKDELDNIVSK